MPCARQTASRFTTEPPPTQITSWASRWGSGSTLGIVNSCRWLASIDSPEVAP